MLSFIAVIVVWSNVLAGAPTGSSKFFPEDFIFRLGVYHIPPFQTLKQIDNSTSAIWSGPVANLIQYFSKYFHLRYELVLPSKSELRRSGLTNTSINQILRNEVDIAVAGLGVSVQRAGFMDFSYPFGMDSFRLISPKPNQVSRLQMIVHPFAHSVWACVLASLLLITVALGVIDWLSTRSISLTCWLYENCLYVLSTTLNQGNWFQRSRASSYLAAASWLLAATVLVNSYSGTLTSFISFPKMEPGVKNFDDLANSRQLSVIVLANTVLSQTILLAKSGAYKVLGDQIRQRDELLIPSLSNVSSLMSTKRYAFPYLETYLYLLVGNDLKTTGKCNFMLSHPLSITHYATLTLQKKGPFNDLISHRMMNLWEAGLVTRGIRSIYPASTSVCLTAKERRTSSPRTYKLSDLISAFLLLGTGLACSLVAFLSEQIYNLRNRFECAGCSYR